VVSQFDTQPFPAISPHTPGGSGLNPDQSWAVRFPTPSARLSRRRTTFPGNASAGRRAADRAAHGRQHREFPPKRCPSSPAVVATSPRPDPARFRAS
jgi:hypothetical protein